MNEHEPINVAAILGQIRAEIQVSHAGSGEETAHLALGVDLDELRDSIAEVEALRAVSAHWPIQGANPRERGVALAQRFVRRALRWYIAPIVEQQNSYNSAVARALQLLLEAQLELAREVARLRSSGSAPTPTSDGAE